MQTGQVEIAPASWSTGMSGSGNKKSANSRARKKTRNRVTEPIREARRTVAREKRAKTAKARRPRIFISYSRQDIAVTKSLARYLVKQGFDPWWDNEIQAGRDFREEIGEQLEAADAVIVIWSETARFSKMVKEEAGTALDEGKLIATHVQGFNAKLLPFGFKGVHSIPVDDRKLLLKSLKLHLPRSSGGGSSPAALPGLPPA
jgi:hypothetical protein